MWCRTCISTCKCCHVSLVLRQLFPGTFPPCLTADVVTSCTNYTSWLPNHSHISHISHIISHITYSYIYIYMNVVYACLCCRNRGPQNDPPIAEDFWSPIARCLPDQIWPTSSEAALGAWAWWNHLQSEHDWTPPQKKTSVVDVLS